MLFDKNGIYYMGNEPKSYDFAIDMINDNYDGKSLKIYNPEEALKRGNAFPGLYDSYKNYAPKELKAKNNRESELLEIQVLDFSINDLNLYLDLNPNDAYAFQLFKKYVTECKEKKDAYAKKYGPLVLDSLTEKWLWSNGVWPWEEGMN